MKTQKTIFPFYLLAMVLLTGFAFGAAALLSRTVFERLPHLEDEVAYLYQAKIFARFQAVAPIPEPRRAYWQPFVVDYSATGSRFGKYTPGWPALLSTGVNLGAPWMVNALLAALTVALIYRLGSEIFNRDTGLIAAALAAFSPMTLLLNASLMGHTAALFYVTLFIFAYWQLEQGRRAVRWGIVAGITLGLLAITRPLPALALAVPFIVWSGVRLLKALHRRDTETPADSQRNFDDAELAPSIISAFERPAPAKSPAFAVSETQHSAPGTQHAVWKLLKPLLALSICTLIISAATPAFNAAATGDFRQNLYELVWSYDKIGFGECCGRNGHTLEKGLRHARFDLSLTAADLFGWQIGTFTPEVNAHLLNDGDYYPNTGLSFVLLLPGLLAGVLWRQKGRSERFWLLAGWMAISGIWLVWSINRPPELLQNASFAWLWMGASLAWILLPVTLLLRTGALPQVRYTWLLWSVLLCVLLFQMTYWIGSQRYSTRYYYEALSAAALLSALPLAWLARHVPRPLIYGGLALVLLYSLFAYSLPRISVLHGFNFIGQAIIQEVEAQREGDTPVLVIVTGSDSGDSRVRWRAMGSLMAVTSPFLDSEIVVAWDYQAAGVREQILSRFPGRQIIEMDATGNEAFFKD